MVVVASFVGLTRCLVPPVFCISMLVRMHRPLFSSISPLQICRCENCPNIFCHLPVYLMTKTYFHLKKRNSVYFYMKTRLTWLPVLLFIVNSKLDAKIKATDGCCYNEKYPFWNSKMRGNSKHRRSLLYGMICDRRHDSQHQSHVMIAVVCCNLLQPGLMTFQVLGICISPSLRRFNADFEAREILRINSELGCYSAEPLN